MMQKVSGLGGKRDSPRGHREPGEDPERFRGEWLSWPDRFDPGLGMGKDLVLGRIGAGRAGRLVFAIKIFVYF